MIKLKEYILLVLIAQLNAVSLMAQTGIQRTALPSPQQVQWHNMEWRRH